MRLKKIISAVLTMAVMPVVPLVHAENETKLFDKVYDMKSVKPDGENGIVLMEDVPDGDYEVRVNTGGDTETNANIYINGGERVRTYTLEAGKTQENVQRAVPKNGKIEVKILGENPNVTDIEITQIENRTSAGEKPTIYIAGDSTAQTYNYEKAYPQTGWGQVFSDFFTNDIVVDNRSMGGRSSKSYDNDGRLDSILTEMHPGDYVFIQFGINDGAENKPERYISVEDYKELIKNKYIGEVKKRGGIPVLLTATAASWWDEENSCFMDSRQDYAVPTREIANETGVNFIDANELITEKWNTMQKKDVLNGYFICEPLESKAYQTGTDDHTHLKQKGAKTIAEIIANALPDCVPELAKYLKKSMELVDIKGHWGENKIAELNKLGFIEGDENGNFMPDKEVTRAEYLNMVMNVCGITGHAYRDGECLDTKQTDWYCYMLQSALDKGLIPPTMINNCKGTESIEKILSEASEDKEAVKVTVTSYIPPDGSVLSFDGNKPITREEMAALTVNCFSYMVKNSDKKLDIKSNLNNGEFSDLSEIKPEYRNTVESAYGYGIISGMGDGTFRPNDFLTKAQAAAALYPVLKISE